MRHADILEVLYKIGAIQFGNFTLKSGKQTSIYINLRKIISYPYVLRTIANAMWEKTINCQYDLVCGVPYTALPIATCLSLDHDIPMIMRRKEKKDYGTKQTIEGVFSAGQTCLIIEDVITSGASIIETADELEAAGIKVKDVVMLIDRQQGGRENLSKKYNVHSIFTISEALNFLHESEFVTDEQRVAIKTFLERDITV